MNRVFVFLAVRIFDIFSRIFVLIHSFQRLSSHLTQDTLAFISYVSKLFFFVEVFRIVSFSAPSLLLRLVFTPAYVPKRKIDIFRNDPCLNGGRCRADGTGGYSCLCRSSHFGTNCEKVNYCRSNPCLNGGICMNIETGKSNLIFFVEVFAEFEMSGNIVS